MKLMTDREVRAAYQERTRSALDNYTLITGEVGMWKSLWARKWGRYISRRPLTVDGIHFTQEDWYADFVTLEPGDAIIMDEWRAHKRLAMHGFRQEQIDTDKEGRQIGANALFCYPDAEEVDDGLLKRFAWWHHKPSRRIVEIRKKTPSKLSFDAHGRHYSAYSWPLVARLPVTGKNDPLRWPYEDKKEARMRDRAARLRENARGRSIDEELPAPAPVKPATFNPALIAKWAGVVQDELKRAA